MADELIELGRKSRSSGLASSGLTGVRCLSVGRALARTECGLAVAARALQNGKAQDLQMGLNTVKGSVRQVAQMMPQGGAVVRKVLSAVSTMDRDLRKEKRLSKSKASDMFRKLQELKLDVDRLFATGAAACPGGKRR